ncbi:T-cell-interacting, activating receptor on myeloid cells protein 1-like [Natator depressus]|uniref:T-cell-interacting, activating receptor on myeloid cells protein 1-like n=1 Tax=Natator depressus TaxID=27790 RepID=UPI003EB71E76
MLSIAIWATCCTLVLLLLVSAPVIIFMLEKRDLPQPAGLEETRALPAPALYLSQTSAQPGDSVWLKCSVLSQLLATRVVFCKDGEEVSSQQDSEEKATYDCDHVVPGGSSGNYTCGYEINDSDNRVTRSQLSPAQHLSVTGALRGPTLYLSPMSARPGDSVLLQCSVFSQFLATRIIFCKDGEEVSSQRGLEKKAIYGYDHVVSEVSSGNYTCGYEIKDSNNRVKRSQLSPAQRLSVSAPPSDFTHGNITRLGLGAMVLLVLGLILAEAYYSCPTGAL